MALGAGSRNLLVMILQEALGVAFIGALLGLIGAQAVAHALSSLLYGVSPTDPLSYSIALVLLTLAALLGSSHPAWRAASANPAASIREE